MLYAYICFLLLCRWRLCWRRLIRVTMLEFRNRFWQVLNSQVTLLVGSHVAWKMSPEPPQIKWRAANKTFDLNELSLMTEHFKGNNNEVGQLKPPNPFKDRIQTLWESLKLAISQWAQLTDWLAIIWDWPPRLSRIYTYIYCKCQVVICSSSDKCGCSDPAQHAGNPPVARHDDLADDTSALVVVRPRVETAQGLVVAAAVALSAATGLAAVAPLVQTAVQLDADFSLQRRQRAGQSWRAVQKAKTR